MRRASFGNKKRSKIEQRTAAMMMLTMRQTLEGVNIESLMRAYGLSEAQAFEMLAAEHKRREQRA